MKLNGAVQEALLSILCFDGAPEGAQFVKALVPLECYDAYFNEIAEQAFAFLDEYKKPPQEHTLDLIDVLKGRYKERREIYERIYQSLIETYRGVNRRFVLDQAAAFVRYQGLKRTCLAAVDHFERDKAELLPEIEKILREGSQQQARLFDPGLILSNTERALKFLERTETDAFPTGIEQLDRLEAGPIRKGLHLFMALSGRGKTWWMVHLAKMAMLNRLKVVHITLEVSEDRLSRRYIQTLFSVSKHKATVIYQNFEKDELQRLIGMDETVLKNRPAFTDPGIHRLLTNKLSLLKQRSPVVIKEFPTGGLKLAQLENYLDGLYSIHRITPDLLIVDGPDNMHKNIKDFRHSLQFLYEGLRGIGVERNCAVAVVSQANRSSLKAKLLNEGSVSEDFSKIATSDVVITYNQTDGEYNLGLARLYIAKNREEKGRAHVLVSQAYDIGQFCLSSVRMVKDSQYWDLIRSKPPIGEIEVDEESKK